MLQKLVLVYQKKQKLSIVKCDIKTQTHKNFKNNKIAKVMISIGNYLIQE